MTQSTAYTYVIRVKGSLADHWATRFDGATFRRIENGDTVLQGRAADQPALFGVLRAIETFGLTVISVKSNPEGRMTKGLHIAVWAAQIVLAVVFAMTGASKTFLPPAELFRMLPDVAGFPLPLVRFIGIAELAAAAGLILPALTRIAPLLTPLAASGVVVVMIGAFVFHVQGGHFAKLPLVIVLGVLAGFVAWARFTRRTSP